MILCRTYINLVLTFFVYFRECPLIYWISIEKYLSHIYAFTYIHIYVSNANLGRVAMGQSPLPASLVARAEGTFVATTQ
jgi:hypothetical protein